MKHKFLIFYSNNTFESVKELDKNAHRLIAKRVINFIYDIEKNIIIGITENGGQDMTVDLV